MADNFLLTKPVEPIVEVLADAGVAIDLMSLVYHDGTYGQPASAQADQATEAANQALFASKFLGISNTKRSGSETADGKIVVATELDVYIPCTSATFVVGDFVAAVEAASGTALENCKVVKTTDPSLAIGQVTKEETAAVTKVWVRLKSRVVPQGVGRGEFTITVPILPHASLTEQNLYVARESVEVISIDIVPDLVQGGALTGTICKAVGTATPANGTTPMHTANTINFNATAHTVQPVTLTSTTADLQLVAGNRIGLDLSAALTTGRAVATIRLRRR
jgi:hypothetical protein